MKKRIPLPKGTILQSRYRILRQLGHGGMGAVYEATDERFKNRSVALKETYADSEETRRAFEREAQLLANTEHEAFPRVIDYFAEEEGYFLVMELIRGRDLADLLREQEEPFEQRKVLIWADQILDALDDLHTNRVIHRDIKPSNLKLTPKGRLKLLDFGIAKGVHDNDAVKFTTVGSLAAATFEYAPLEQVLKANIDWFSALSVNYPEKTAAILQKSTDAPSDLYALSATLYQLLTKRLPVNAPTRALAVWAGLPDKVRPAHELNPKISPLVSKLLQKGLELDRKDRFYSAEEMRKALRKVILNLKGRAVFVKDPPQISEAEPPKKTIDKRLSIVIPKVFLDEDNPPTIETVQPIAQLADNSSNILKEAETSNTQIVGEELRKGLILHLHDKKQKPIARIPAKIKSENPVPVSQPSSTTSKSKQKVNISTTDLPKFEPKLLFQQTSAQKNPHKIHTILAVVGIITILSVVIGMAAFQKLPLVEAANEKAKETIKPELTPAAVTQTQPIAIKQKVSQPSSSQVKKAYSQTEKTPEDQPEKADKVETPEVQFSTLTPTSEVKRSSPARKTKEKSGKLA